MHLWAPNGRKTCAGLCGCAVTVRRREPGGICAETVRQLSRVSGTNNCHRPLALCRALAPFSGRAGQCGGHSPRRVVGDAGALRWLEQEGCSKRGGRFDCPARARLAGRPTASIGRLRQPGQVQGEASPATATAGRGARLADCLPGGGVAWPRPAPPGR